ncbi:MAG: MBL fold metallo-hydrolase [Promethearchaeota archaeon]
MTNKEFKKIEFNSKYFTLYELSDGIYAAQINTEFYTGGNAGIFDLGGCIIIWDTGLYADVGQDLYKAAKDICGNEPNLVVLSHHHIDHLFGIYKIPTHIPILTGPGVVEQIKEYSLPRINEFEENPEEKIKELKEKLKDETDPVQKVDKETDIKFYEELIQQNLKFRMPTITFTGEMTFQGTKTKMILKNVSERHSGEDILAIFPEEKICFMGDLFFSNIDEIPLETAVQFFTTNIEKHTVLLESLYESDIEIFHSGHGPIEGPEMIKKNYEFIQNKLKGKELGTGH